MKKITVLVLGIVMVSCSSSRVEKQIINDFLDKEFLTDKNVRVLVEEALPKIKALEYYENAYKERNLYEGVIRFAPNGNPPFTWAIDSIEIDALKQKYKNDTLVYHWKKSDFKKPNFKIYPYEMSRRSDIPELGLNGIYLSKPLITFDQKYAFIFYRTFAVGIGFGSGKAVLMRKENDKWVEQYNYTNTKSSN